MKFLAVICTSICVFFPLTLSAQTVVLQSKTGNVRVDGTLVDYDGEFYRVKTNLGILTIDARTVNCSGDGCPSAQDMTSRFSVSASGDLGLTLIPALLEAYSLSLDGEITAENPSLSGQTLKIQDGDGIELAEIDIKVTPEDVAYADLAKGGDLLIATTRLPDRSEAAAVNNPEQKQILASDGIIAAVSSVNPLNTISIASLRKILTGEITNWREVGGPDIDIDLYLPTSNDGFKAVLNDSRIGLKPSQLTSTAIQLDSLADVSDAAAANPFGLGITSFSNLRNATPLGLKESCGIYSTPSVFTLKSGDYPLTYNHYFFRPEQRLPVFAREFLDFVKSDQAQNVIRATGYADLAISTLSLDHQGLRLATAIGQAEKESPLSTVQEMVRLQNGAQRLSTTFRFQPGTKTLDSQSKQNASLLASGLILGNYADKQVHIIGFTDSAGSSTQNIALAKKAAQMVLNSIITAAPEGSLGDVDFQVSGFGEASPLACDDTEAGKRVNRRVEIWIKES